MRGCIFSGFPCIGKTSLTSTIFVGQSIDSFIDLESSMMFGSDGKRPDNWVELYVNYADDLAKQGYHVFVSTHDSVRKELTKRGISFTAIYPAIELKDEWLEKLCKRYNDCPSDKNLKAWNFMEDGTHYDDAVNSMSQEKSQICLRDINYSLKDEIQLFLKKRTLS